MPPRRCLSRRRLLGGLAGGALLGVALPPHARGHEEPIVNFYNWDTYIGETTLDDFRRETGIVARMDLFADNAELVAKLRGGNPGYDVIVPTNDFVALMIAAGMLQPLDHDKLPNLANIDPFFRDSDFDPGRRHSVPYMWGTIGMGMRKSRVGRPLPNSWGVLYDSARYAGRLAMLSEPSTVFQLGFKYLGLPLNTTDPVLIDRLADLLIEQKRNIRVFAEDNGQDLLLSGDVDIAMEFSGDILQVMSEDPDLTYVIPKEGGLLWEDSLCIPVGAPHPDNAHRFIDYLMEPRIAADIADFIGYATPNRAARAMMDPAYSQNDIVFPPQDILEKSEVARYLGDDYLRDIDRAWTRVQAA